MRPEGTQDVPDVVADRLLAQVEHGGDLVGRRAFPEQLQHLIQRLSARDPLGGDRRR